MNLSYLNVDLICPMCGFTISVILKQVIAEETILCSGCLEEIQLIDDGGSSQRAERDINDGLDQFRRFFGN